MRLVDDDGETAAPVLIADLVQNEGEFLHRGNDDFLPRLDEFPQVTGSLGMAYDGPDLSELPDGIPNLPVQNTPVGYDDDRMENRSVILMEFRELVRQPCYGVRFAASGGMLNEIAPPRSVFRYVLQQFAHYVELVETGPYLHGLLAPGLPVSCFDDLCVVLYDVSEAITSENLPPQIVCFQPIGVGGIARAVVPSPVEREKPRSFALEMRAKLHLVVVHRKMRHAAPEREQFFARIAVPFVLFDGILRRLFGQAVFQFEGGDGKPVDEQAQSVQRQLRVVETVAKLAGYAETVLAIAFLCSNIFQRGSAVEKINLVRAVLYAAAQRMDRALFSDATFKTGQKFAPGRIVIMEIQ